MSLARTFPADRLRALVSVLQPILDLNVATGRFRSAENAARACIEVARRAAEQDPQAQAYLASSYSSLAASLMNQGRLDEALAEASRSAQIARQVAAMNMPGFDNMVLVTALRLVENLAKACGRPDEARAAQLEIRAQRSNPAGPG
jgi:tetratricopeptide (TPR) repeat protein